MTESSSTESRAVSAVRRSSPALLTGLRMGAMLIVVMLGALVAANRVPALERYALERNGASYSLFVILMLVPVARFLRRPVQMFTAGMTAWILFVIAYDFAGMYFRDLFDVLRTPFEALIEGGVIYGVLAVISWVVEMVLHARRHSILPERRRPRHAHDHHQ